MRFTPKTQEEINAMGLIDPGQYSFEVIEASEQVSQAGNEMIKLQLKVWDINGRERIVFDYLLEAMAFKLIHFCEATGLKDKYDAGCLTADACIGKSAKLELGIDKGKQKQDGTYYPDKNSVKDYLNLSIAQAEKPTAEAAPFDDDIPF